MSNDAQKLKAKIDARRIPELATPKTQPKHTPDETLPDSLAEYCPSFLGALSPDDLKAIPMTAAEARAFYWAIWPSMDLQNEQIVDAEKGDLSDDVIYRIEEMLPTMNPGIDDTQYRDWKSLCRAGKSLANKIRTLAKARQSLPCKDDCNVVTESNEHSKEGK